MPFLSYHVSIEDAVKNAGRLVKEVGAHAVSIDSFIPSLLAFLKVCIVFFIVFSS